MATSPNTPPVTPKAIARDPVQSGPPTAFRTQPTPPPTNSPMMPSRKTGGLLGGILIFSRGLGQSLARPSPQYATVRRHTRPRAQNTHTCATIAAEYPSACEV